MFVGIGGIHIPGEFYSLSHFSGPPVYLSLLAIVFAFLFITILKIRRRKLSNPSPEALRTCLQNLYKAIKDKNIEKAYILSTNLFPFFDELNYRDYLSGGLLSDPKYIFQTKGFDAVGVHWNKLIEKFLDILNKYKTFDSNKRSLSLEQIDGMIYSLKNQGSR